MEHKQPTPQDKDPELKQPDETIKDLEPEKEEGEKVKGGVDFTYSKVTYEYK